MSPTKQRNGALGAREVTHQIDKSDAGSLATGLPTATSNEAAGPIDAIPSPQATPSVAHHVTPAIAPAIAPDVFAVPSAFTLASSQQPALSAIEFRRGLEAQALPSFSPQASFAITSATASSRWAGSLAPHAPSAAENGSAENGSAETSSAETSTGATERAAQPDAAANRPTRVPRVHRMFGAVALAALFMSTVTLAGLGFAAYRYRSALTLVVPEARQDDGNKTKRAALPTHDDEDEHLEAPARLNDVRQQTETSIRGAIEVVDVGAAAPPMVALLGAQRALALTKKQKLVVMLTGHQCDPCQEFDDGLEHPEMQEALRNVRLVRVDLEVFKEELKGMDVPIHLYPAFFLLDDDLRPLDAVHGGEWDEDVPTNIAPVLGPFIRGTLKNRRHPNWSPTTSAIPI